MPNWCSSYVTIHTEPETADKIYDALDKAMHIDYFVDEGPEYFHDSWLGNLIGYPDKTLAEVEECQFGFRGYITDYEKDFNVVRIWMESAWNPMFGAIEYFLAGLDVLDKVQIYYTSEECGNGVYVSNEPDVVGTYVFYNDDTGSEYDLNESELRECIAEQCEREGVVDETADMTIDDAIKWADYNLELCSINKFEYEDFEVFCE